MHVKKTVLAVLVTSLLYACGGSSDAPVQTGTFVDAPVEGLSYRTATQSGVTDASGRFRFIAGEMVQFSFGGVSLPPVLASAIVTPVEMGSEKETSDATTLAVARFLQALDTDANPENGITLNSAFLKSGATTPTNWATTGSALNTLVDDASKIPNESRAMQHLAKSLAKERQEPSAVLVGRYDANLNGNDTGLAEIVSYHEASKSVFATLDSVGNPSSFIRISLNGLPITALANPLTSSNLTAATPVSVAANVNGGSFTAGGVQSLDVAGNLLAVAVSSSTKTSNGVIAFYSIAADGNTTFIKSVVVGVLPDSVAFTPDGSKLVVANEGELPTNFTTGSIDPEGSISVIAITNGVPSDTAVTLGFTDFNVGGSRAAELPSDFRVGRPGATVAQDAEPEYVAFSDDGKEAYVTLQENNAVAIIDLSSNTPRISKIVALGYKDHGLARNALAPSDQVTKKDPPDLISIPNLFGVYMPDGIAGFTANGKRYFITANEGDDRNDFIDPDETARLSSFTLDSTAFPNGTALKANTLAGRLTLLKTTGSGAFGDVDNDADYDKLYTLGGRSFSIYEASTGRQVYDSGSDLERYAYANADTESDTAKRTAMFNVLADRFDNKGPEPEAIAVGKVRDQLYAFVGLERASAIVIYNITNPEKPQFVQYIRNSSTLADGDVSPEGMKFVPAAKSPNGKALLLVGYGDVSGTVAVYQFD